MSETSHAREEDYQALITFIGRIGQQLIELGKQVEDEQLSKRLLDLADQCVGEFFGGVIGGCASKPDDDSQD